MKLSNTKLEPKDYIIQQLRKNNKVHGLQLLMYSFLLHKSTTKQIEEAGIVSFISHKSSPFFVDFDLSLESVEPLLQAVIQTIINEMSDPTLPFVHNEHAKYCAYCN